MNLRTIDIILWTLSHLKLTTDGPLSYIFFVAIVFPPFKKLIYLILSSYSDWKRLEEEEEEEEDSSCIFYTWSKWKLFKMAPNSTWFYTGYIWGQWVHGFFTTNLITLVGMDSTNKIDWKLHENERICILTP